MTTAIDYNFSIFKAALTVRLENEHVEGFVLDGDGDTTTNMFLIHHDALHYYLGAAPVEAEEYIVVYSEYILAGLDTSTCPDIDEVTSRLGLLPTELIEELMEYYTAFYSEYLGN